MTRNQNTLLVGVAIAVAFLLAGGAALCNPQNYADRQERADRWAEYDAMTRDPDAYNEAKRRELLDEYGVDDREPEGPTRVAGAYYPEDHAEQASSSGGIDPLILAVVGGGLVFGLAGGVAFLVLGGGGSQEEDEPQAPEEDEFAGLVEIPEDPPY